MRTFCLAVAAALFSSGAVAADSERFPSRPIRLVVPFAPGGTVDVIARLIGAKMSELVQQQVVVDNRGGAGGVVGTELVARAAPDGYTLLLHSAGLAYEPALRAKLPYNAMTDLAAISVVGATPNLLVVHPQFTARSARELVRMQELHIAVADLVARVVGFVGVRVHAVHHHFGVRPDHFGDVLAQGCFVGRQPREAGETLVPNPDTH